MPGSDRLARFAFALLFCCCFFARLFYITRGSKKYSVAGSTETTNTIFSFFGRSRLGSPGSPGDPASQFGLVKFSMAFSRFA